MSGHAVPFDEQLTVVHRIGGSTGCPRAVPEWVLSQAGRPEWGTRLVLHRCGRPVGHDGTCERRERAFGLRTVCGLAADGPWIDYPPDAARSCPACHGHTPDPPLF